MKNLIIIISSIVIFASCEKDDVQPTVITACFTYQINETNHKEVHFFNCSENATSYLWDFGDGTSSTEEEPVHVYIGDFPFLAKLVACNENESDSVFKEVTDIAIVRKPNIYIYPQEEMDLVVSLLFPLGGEVVASIPEYNNGWDIHIDTDGMIDDQYNYLFYECKHPNLYQNDKGFCIEKNELKSFFEKNMSLYHFSPQEIKDFTDYWIPLLNEFDYYAIYPQTGDIIDKNVQLEFSVIPDNVNRLFYGIQGIDQCIELEAPVITPFTRSGFFVVEWGVFLKP